METEFEAGVVDAIWKQCERNLVQRAHEMGRTIVAFERRGPDELSELSIMVTSQSSAGRSDTSLAYTPLLPGLYVADDVDWIAQEMAAYWWANLL